MNILLKNIEHLENTVCEELNLKVCGTEYTDDFPKHLDYNAYILWTTDSDIILSLSVSDYSKMLNACRLPDNMIWTVHKMGGDQVYILGKNLCSVREIRSAIKSLNRLVLLGIGTTTEIIISKKILRRITISLMTQIIYNHDKKFTYNMALFYVRNDKVLKQYNKNKKAAF